MSTPRPIADAEIFAALDEMERRRDAIDLLALRERFGDVPHARLACALGEWRARRSGGEPPASRYADERRVLESDPRAAAWAGEARSPSSDAPAVRTEALPPPMPTAHEAGAAPGEPEPPPRRRRP